MAGSKAYKAIGLSAEVTFFLKKNVTIEWFPINNPFYMITFV